MCLRRSIRLFPHSTNSSIVFRINASRVTLECDFSRLFNAGYLTSVTYLLSWQIFEKIPLEKCDFKPLWTGAFVVKEAKLKQCIKRLYSRRADPYFSDRLMVHCFPFIMLALCNSFLFDSMWLFAIRKSEALWRRGFPKGFARLFSIIAKLTKATKNIIDRCTLLHFCLSYSLLTIYSFC